MLWPLSFFGEIAYFMIYCPKGDGIWTSFDLLTSSGKICEGRDKLYLIPFPLVLPS
jgi:hypothetical protein